MISFAFYQKMRPILAEGQFNPNEYSHQELQMLVESLPMIKSEYCNEEFRRGFLEFLNSEGQEANLESAEKFALKALGHDSPSSNFFVKLLHEHSTIEEATSRLDSMKVVFSQGEEALIELRPSEYTSYSYAVEQTKQLFSDRTYSIQSIDHATYYCQFLCTQDYYQTDDVLAFFRFVTMFIKNEAAYNALVANTKVDNLAHIFEDNIKNSWLGEEDFEQIPSLVKNSDFFQSIITHKAWHGIEIAIKAFQEPEQFQNVKDILVRKYIGDQVSVPNEEDISSDNLLDKIEFNPENAEEIFNILDNTLKVNPDYPNVDFTPLEQIGFDVQKLKFLGSKYQMPSVILRELINEEVPKFKLAEDNVAQTLAPAFKILSKESLNKEYEKVSFKAFTKKVEASDVTELALEYQIPSDVLTNVINNCKFGKRDTKESILEKLKAKFEEIQSQTKTDNSLEFRIDGYTVSLLPKSDPTSLFVGKMTSSCQFYTGHSSEQAVIPVYTDSNAGLIVIASGKEQKTAKAACFAWLSEDGLVLDSFEAPGKDCDDAFLPFVTALAIGLKEIGLNLYVGTGGHTPELLVNGANAQFEPTPPPLSEDFEPYGDSRQVYLIDPDQIYSIKSKIKEIGEYVSINHYLEMMNNKELADKILEHQNALKCINYLLNNDDSKAKDILSSLFTNLNSYLLDTFITYVNGIEKLRELGTKANYNLSGLNQALGLNVLFSWTGQYSSISEIEKKIKLFEALPLAKEKITVNLAEYPETKNKIIKTLEKNLDQLSSDKELDSLASNCVTSNLNIIEEVFEIFEKLNELGNNTYILLHALNCILARASNSNELYGGPSLEDLKKNLDLALKAKDIKTEISTFKEKFEEALKNLPENPINQATIKKLKASFKKAISEKNTSPKELNAIPNIISKLNNDSISKIAEYFEFASRMKEFNQSYYADSPLNYISQIIHSSDPKPGEYRMTLDNLRSSLDQEVYRQKIPEYQAQLDRLTSSFAGSINSETIEKLKAGIDKATCSDEINAISIVMPSLTKENIDKIEEFLELASRLNELDQKCYIEQPFYHIAQILDNSSVNPGEYRQTLDSLRSGLLYHESLQLNQFQPTSFAPSSESSYGTPYSTSADYNHNESAQYPSSFAASTPTHSAYSSAEEQGIINFENNLTSLSHNGRFTVNSNGQTHTINFVSSVTTTCGEEVTLTNIRPAISIDEVNVGIQNNGNAALTIIDCNRQDNITNLTGGHSEDDI